ncbi:ArsR/SmtB family transcription factor [Dictyobacter aurantiacus]|uniref:Transcriptional regulator n=1 Tax=Dictyobacter aurantiacus TaxID=1936993 RepID=A0A401ZDV2_9CHLR|nr:winged helix-turn-helix domain-containing protein [Dictyobacter aurantiacus]GCE05016.1 transcriptional regulator [Dictyobacter aurantiacus]
MAAELIADPSRAAILDALMEKRALTAGELARQARVTPQTASSHLAKLVAGGLLTMTTQGRHRYYALASAEVAYCLEALACIAPSVPIRSLRESLVEERLHVARTCYDHLAGKLGVELTQIFIETRLLTAEGQNYAVTNEGARFFLDFGLDLELLRRQRRMFARQCLDWSERRYHLAGSLGTAIARQLFERGWLEKIPSCRALRVTDKGRVGLLEMFGLRM